MLSIKQLLFRLKIKTQQLQLYEEAVTHRSFSNEHGYDVSYERLEFLGDAIIHKLVSEYLFSLNLSEGEMSKIRIQIVQSETLIRAAKEINLDQTILLGKGLQKDPSPSIIEDVFEAFIAALYLDQGEKKVKEIIDNTIIKYHSKNDLSTTIDYKTLLQEVLEHNPKNQLFYKLVKKTKTADDTNSFLVEVWWNQICYGRGEGKKLKEAEKLAAKDAYQKIANN